VCIEQALRGLRLQDFKGEKVGQWLDRQILCDHVTFLMFCMHTAWPEVVKCIWRAPCISVAAEGKLMYNLYQSIGGIFLIFM
jgi:hypothetical protein